MNTQEHLQKILDDHSKIKMELKSKRKLVEQQKKKQEQILTTSSSSSREAQIKCIPTADTEPNTSDSGSDESHVSCTPSNNTLKETPSPEEELSPKDTQVLTVFELQEEPIENIDLTLSHYCNSGVREKPMGSYLQYEIDLLKIVMREYAIPEVQKNNKTWETPELWEGIKIQYNKSAASEELHNSNRTVEEIQGMATYVSFCDCGLNPRDGCPHMIVTIPTRSMSVSGGSRGSRKRSYDTISSSSMFLLDDQVAEQINYLEALGKISVDVSDKASYIYSRLIEEKLTVVVRRFLRSSSVDAQVKRLSHDLLKYDTLCKEAESRLHGTRI